MIGNGWAPLRILWISPLLAILACGTTDESSMPSPTTDSGPATLAVLGGRIWTGNPLQPWASALAVRGETLLAVGDDDAIAPLLDQDTEVLRADGGLVVPGLIDSHVHFLESGFRLSSVQLRDVTDPQVFTERIAEFARDAPAGAWITGGDWDHQGWGGDLPSRDWIDAATPEHPVWVHRLDGHMALANSHTLELAGIGPATPEVEGGEIVRDRFGRPTGVLKDNAMDLVERVRPAPPAELEDRALAAAMDFVGQRGVTAVHHMGTFEDLAVFERAHRDGRLRTRIHAAVPLAEWRRLEAMVAERGRGDDWLQIGMLKGFVDGSLGSHTAWFFDPFTDSPDDRGLLLRPLDELGADIVAADAAGLQLAVHAIGDRAIASLLDLYAGAALRNGERDRRWRIEHAQHLRLADIPRFETLGVIASMQPYHAIDDGRWAERVIGPERIRTTYAFRSLLDAGATLAFGSDWFVAPPTPLEGIDAAVSRRTLDGKNPGGWVPEQRIGVEDALRAYTRGAAFAGFQADRLGSLEAGKLADLVIIDRDLFAIAPETIPESRIVATVVGGRMVYRAAR